MPLAPTLCPLGIIPLSEERRERAGEWEEARGCPQSLPGLDTGVSFFEGLSWDSLAEPRPRLPFRKVHEPHCP